MAPCPTLFDIICLKKKLPAFVIDGWKGYHPIDSEKYAHEQQVAKHIEDKDSVLPGVHRIAFLVKRLMLSTFQGRFGPSHPQSYLDEYVFRFNRRKSRYIGKKCMRIEKNVNVIAVITDRGERFIHTTCNDERCKRIDH